MAMVRVGDGEIAVISQYCHKDNEAIDPELQRAVEFCQVRSIPLIIGADSNAWSPLWGPDQNERGEKFEEFIGKNHLHVLNDGKKPTYYHKPNNGKTKTYIDITLINNFAYNKSIGGEWMVNDEETLSDHKMLTFNTQATSAPPRLSRNLKDVNWGCSGPM